MAEPDFRESRDLSPICHVCALTCRRGNQILPKIEGIVATMITPIIMPNGQGGYIFEGKAPQTFCFVPETCVKMERDKVLIDELEYVRSGWDLKNMRISNAPSGNHLFPQSSHPVNDFTTEPVKAFLERVKALVPPEVTAFDAPLPPPFPIDPGIDPIIFL